MGGAIDSTFIFAYRVARVYFPPIRPDHSNFLITGIATTSLYAIFYYGTPNPSGIFTYFSGVGSTGGILASTSFLLLLLFRSRRWLGWGRDNGQVAKLLTIVAYLTPIFLFDDSGSYDYDHYLPYVGPAANMLNGGIPFGDSYSPYGFLPTLLFYAAFKFLGNGFGSGSLMVSFLGVGYGIFMAHLIMQTMRWRVMSASIAIICVCFYSLGHQFNFAITPSQTLLRFLPCVLILMVLAHADHKELAPTGMKIILMLSSIWSVETFLFTVVMVCSISLWRCLEQKLPLLQFYFVLKSYAIHTAIFWALFYVIFFLVFSTVINPFPYLEMLFGFNVTKDLGAFELFQKAAGNSFWTLLNREKFIGWIIFSTAFQFSLLHGLRVLNKKTDYSFDVAYSKIVFPSTVFGTLIIVYFVGRSDPVVLAAYTPPLFIVLTWILNKSLHSTTINKKYWKNISVSVIVLSLGLMSAIICHNFMIPIPKKDDYHSNLSHSVLLKRCFTEQGCGLASVKKRLAQAVQTRPLIDNAPKTFTAGLVSQEVMADVVEIASKNLSNQKEAVFLLGRYYPAFILYTNFDNILPISNPQTDQYHKYL